jgi:uncharacterized protein YutE (UPF0331/DUF86 family)
VPPDVYLKKLEQMAALVSELHSLLERPLDQFLADRIAARAAERDFQLLVNLAVDINLYLLAERSRSTPDSYRESFLALVPAGVLERSVAEPLARSARLRNVLVHDYDFDTDVELFHRSARGFLEPYRQYMRAVHRALRG